MMGAWIEIWGQRLMSRELQDADYGIATMELQTLELLTGSQVGIANDGVAV